MPPAASLTPTGGGHGKGSMPPDMYEAAAVAIRQCRTTLDRYAAELSEEELGKENSA